MLDPLLYKTILIPLDGSPGSWKAFDKAVVIAKRQQAELTALSVDEHLPHFAATVGEVDEEQSYASGYFANIQAEAIARASMEGVALKTRTMVGHAAQIILRYAKEESADLIVISHIGHSGVWGVLLGSTTSRVVDQAHCDVLVVR